MTIEELKAALQEKGYQYSEAKEPRYGYTMVIATKNGTLKTVGVKNLLLNSSLDFFKSNDAYRKL